MVRSITAIVVKGSCQVEVARKYDLQLEPLGCGLTLFYIDVCFSAYWQQITGTKGRLPIRQPSNFYVPNERVILKIVRELVGLPCPDYALIAIDRFGSEDIQWAQSLQGSDLANRAIATVNDALKALGVSAVGDRDESETVGLHKLSFNPEYLDKYEAMVAHLGG